jgi:ferredoxin
MTLPAELRAHLEEELRGGRVTAVLGPAAARHPTGIAFFARTPADLERLTLGPLAAPNLLVHLTRPETRPGPGETIAVLARACETRTLNQIFTERALPRDRVHVVGLDHCGGVIDEDKLLDRLPALVSFPEVAEDGADYVVTHGDDEDRVNKRDVLRDRCIRCGQRDALVHDARFSIGPPEPSVEPPDSDATRSDMEAVETLSHEERRAMWHQEFARCIRCYACRDACPLCYCSDCILERQRPQWIGRATGAQENAAFQLQRVLDLAGRCTECEECERACPEGLPLMLLVRKTNEEVKKSFGFESGQAAEQLYPLSTFGPNDPKGFIL